MLITFTIVLLIKILCKNHLKKENEFYENFLFFISLWYAKKRGGGAEQTHLFWYFIYNDWNNKLTTLNKKTIILKCTKNFKNLNNK